MNNVRVNLNSNRPAQLNALVYTHGTEIHIGPEYKTSSPRVELQQKTRKSIVETMLVTCS